MKRERSFNHKKEQSIDPKHGKATLHQRNEDFWTGLLNEVCKEMLPANFIGCDAISFYGNMVVFLGKRNTARQLLKILMQPLLAALLEQHARNLQIAVNQYADRLVLELKVDQNVHLSEPLDAEKITESITSVLHESESKGRFVMKKLMSTQHSIGISLTDTLSHLKA